MAIMQSCCCFGSVRKGSYACAIYTTVYYGLIVLVTSMTLRAEIPYLKGDISQPTSDSFLESGTISPVTVIVNGMMLICSSCGVLSSLLLLYGVYKDRKMLLIPWMVSVVSCAAIDMAHSLYTLFIMPHVEPEKYLLHTLNFFVFCLNIYSLLCVISQYQEYLVGRGTAANDYGHRDPVVTYVTQAPTTTATTSFISSRKGETKATPTQSPATGRYPILSEKSPTGGRILTKHVQFPDASELPSQTERPGTSKEMMPKKGSPKSARSTRIWLQPND